MEGYLEAVTCELKYSGAALALLLAAALATEALLLATPLSIPLRAACMAYVFLQAARSCRALLAVRGLHLGLHRAIEVRDARGHWQAGTVRDGCFVLPWLVVVRWRPAGGRIDRTVLLVPGMAGEEAMRNIRVILRFDSGYRARVYTTGEQQ